MILGSKKVKSRQRTRARFFLPPWQSHRASAVPGLHLSGNRVNQAYGACDIPNTIPTSGLNWRGDNTMSTLLSAKQTVRLFI